MALFGAAALMNRCRTPFGCNEGIELRERGSRLPTTAGAHRLCAAPGRLPPHFFLRPSSPPSLLEVLGALRRVARAREPSEIARSGAPVGGAVALWPRSLSRNHAPLQPRCTSRQPQRPETKAAPHHSTPTAPRREHVTKIQAQSA